MIRWPAGVVGGSADRAHLFVNCRGFGTRNDVHPFHAGCALASCAWQGTAMIPASAILDRVEAGEIDALTAARQLGVTRARVNQLLRRRRAGGPEPLTTTMIAKLDSPRGRRANKKRAPSIEPVSAQIKHNRRIRTISRRGLIAADSEWKAFGAGRRGQPA
jgi:hypothetical protein